MAIGVDNVLLPANVQAMSVGGLASDTAIDASTGGLEQRDGWLPTQFEKFNARFGPNEVPTLRAMFRCSLGPVRSFLIDDLDDDIVSDIVQQKNTAGGVTVIQLRQGYTQGAITVYRPVHRFSSAAITITVDGTPTSSYTGGNATDGVLTFSSLIGGEIRATIPKFYKIAHFAEDRLTITREMGAIREIQSCSVISEILPPQIDADVPIYYFLGV